MFHILNREKQHRQPAEATLSAKVRRRWTSISDSDLLQPWWEQEISCQFLSRCSDVWFIIFFEVTLEFMTEWALEKLIRNWHRRSKQELAFQMLK